jgi:hypothetical protein
LIAEVGQRRAAPECQRPRQRPAHFGRTPGVEQPAAIGDQRFELAGVEPVPTQVQAVALGLGDQPDLLAEDPAQVGDVRPQ